MGSVAEPGAFVSRSGETITRLLNHTLAAYVDSPPGSSSKREVTMRLSNLGGRQLRCLLCNQSPGVNYTVTLHHDSGTVTVTGLTPRRFYLFNVTEKSQLDSKLAKTE